MICKHCEQPIFYRDQEWQHHEHGAWFYSCQRTDIYGSTAEPQK